MDYYLINAESKERVGRILATITIDNKIHYSVITLDGFKEFPIDDKNYRVETSENGDLQVISANRSAPKEPK